MGDTKCADRCAEIGKEWRKKDEARQKSLNAASKKRKELVTEAQKQRMDVEHKIEALQVQIEAQEKKAANLEAEVAETERRERGKVVKGDAKMGKLGVLSGLAKQRVGELRESLVKVREERDTSKGRVQELETILSTFKEEYNPNFNDEGVKRAVRAWEDYAARDKTPDGDAAHDRDLDELVKSDKENGLDWDSFVDTEQAEVELRKSNDSLLLRYEANIMQYTSSKSIYQSLFVNGWTKSSATCASSSLKTECWPTCTQKVQSPPPFSMPERTLKLLKTN